MDRLEHAVSAAAAHGFSGAVRVSIDGTVVIEGAHGRADRERAIDNTVETRFGIASGTKLLTALGVGVLIEDGRAALDTQLVDVVSASLPNVSADVTLGHLLTHTSGVHDYYDEELIDDFDGFELAVPPAELATLNDYLPLLTAGPMKFRPGARFSYSNGGYILLGLAIEALSGIPYHRFITDRVLQAAGMSGSGFFRLDELPDRTAVGYVDTEAGWTTNADKLPVRGGADGGAYSTVADIERLWSALLGHRILSPGLTATFTASVSHSQGGLHYGHGLWIRAGRLHIEGADAGVSFKSTCYGPGTVATVVSNTSRGAWPVADAIDAAMTPSDGPPAGSR